MDDGASFDEMIPRADAAKILKGSDFEALTRARADVDLAQQQADAILANAHAEAEKIREDA